MIFIYNILNTLFYRYLSERLCKYINDGEIMECVYETLNKNNIEIPFPQREITIRHANEEEYVALK